MPTKPKPLTISQLREDIVDLETALELEETKVKNLKEQQDRLKVANTKFVERENVTIQAMTFIVTYCAKEVKDQVPPVPTYVEELECKPERLLGTQEGSVMAWSVAKNWLEGHWANSNQDDRDRSSPYNWERKVRE